MVTALTALMAKVVGERFARAAAIASLVLAFLGISFALKAAYDASVVERHTTKANNEFLEDKDEATGRADRASDERRAQVGADVERTKELIDEAMEKGCALGEYLASNGDRCVRG